MSSKTSASRDRELPQTIAIDGPVASGKSTIGELLAKELGYLYFDTGVMYRAVAWAALDRGIAPDDDPAVASLARDMLIDVLPPTVQDGRQYTVLADGEDVTWDIRTPDVDVAVSPVSANAGVRAALTPQQRRIALAGPVVMAGRDIGTVVIPEADLKLYLDAEPVERARRRYQEMISRGLRSSESEVLNAVVRRDAYDTERTEAPLRQSEDAVHLDSTGMSVVDVLERSLEVVHEWQSESRGGDLVINNVHSSVEDGPKKPANPPRPGLKPDWRRVLAPILRGLIRMLLRVDTEGEEYVPEDGPVILILNHIHLLDPVVLVAVLPRFGVAVAKEEIMGWPIIGPVVARYPTIPVKRGELDMQAMRRSLVVLAADQALIVAPEGTRSRSSTLQEGKMGMVFLAHRHDALVQPVAVTGTPDFPVALKKLRRVPVRYRYGQPFRFRWPEEGRPNREIMREMADQAMYEVARLLPPDMRGIYSDIESSDRRWLRYHTSD